MIRLPITRKSRPDPIIAAMQKRSKLSKRDPFLASLYNDQGSQYLIDISVGTPAQISLSHWILEGIKKIKKKRVPRN